MIKIIRIITGVTNVAINMKLKLTWRITKRENMQRNMTRDGEIRMKENNKRERKMETKQYVIFVKKNLRIGEN